MELNIRPATAADLTSLFHVWLAAEGEEPDDPLTDADGTPSALPHALATGRVLVAEECGRIVGFAATVTREPVTYLGQLFISPKVQSAGIGKALLQAIMPDDGGQRAIVSSSDPRAVGLYVRHGLRPFWPVFDLKSKVERLRAFPQTDVEVVMAETGDPDLVRWDAEIGGRLRPQDHAYWVERKGGAPLWFERRGKRLGYGYVQVQPQSSDARWYGDTVRVGPLGVREAADAVDCLIGALGWARERGGRLSLLVPGPHPALRPLLDAGFQIGDIETFLSSTERPFTDGQRYIPSGGGLF